MDYQPPQPKPMAITAGKPKSNLEQVLGERNQLNNIKQKMNASYPPKAQERKKAFSSSPRTIDI